MAANTTRRTTAKKNTIRSLGPTNGDVISIVAAKRKTIPVDLIGVRYNVTPPKASAAIRMMGLTNLDLDSDDNTQALNAATQMMEAYDDLVTMMFGAKAQEIRDRMNDPEDALDIQHISELSQALQAASTDNPPT